MNASRSIINVFKCAFSPHIKTPLGRWNIHNYGETALKIKYATEDNCGIYSYNYKNNTAPRQEEELRDNDENYLYVMGYESTHQ